MRRFYVAPMAVVEEHRELMGSGRARYIKLDETHALVSVNLASETAEDRWHSHPEVAILPDPVFEGNDKIKAHLAKPSRKLRQHHVNALAKIGFGDTDSVLDLEAHATKINRGMKLRSIL
jgi:hypothetical protein